MEKDKNIDFKLFDTLNEYESQLPAGGWEGLSTRKETKHRKKIFFTIAATMLVLSGFSFLIIPEYGSRLDNVVIKTQEDNELERVPKGQAESKANEALTTEAIKEDKKPIKVNVETAIPEILKPQYTADFAETIEFTRSREIVPTIYIPIGEPAVEIPSSVYKNVATLPDNFKYKRKIVPALYLEYSNGAGQMDVSSNSPNPNKNIMFDGNNKAPSIKREQFEIGAQLNLSHHFTVGLGAAYSQFRVNSGPFYSYPDSLPTGVSSVNKDKFTIMQEPLPQYAALSFKPWVRYQAGRRWKVHLEAGLRGEYLFNKKGGIDYVDQSFKIAPDVEKYDDWNWVLETGIGVSYPVYKSMRIYAGYSLGRSLNSYYQKNDLSIGLNFQELKIRVEIPLTK